MKTLSFLKAVGVMGILGMLAGQVEAASRAHGRSYSTEFYILGQGLYTQTIGLGNVTLPVDAIPTLETHNMRLDLHNTFMFGVGVGYHFNEHLAIKGEFAFGEPGYTATWGNDVVRGDAMVQTGKLNFEYNILRGPLTPFVSGGIGYFYLNTDIPDGPPQYWWDYWWGPVVVQPTKSDTYFTYNVAAGLRWDFVPGATAKLSVGGNWLNVGNGAGQVRTIEVSLGVGWLF